MNARVCLAAIIRRACRRIVLAEVSEKNGGQATLRRRKAGNAAADVQEDVTDRIATIKAFPLFVGH